MQILSRIIKSFINFTAYRINVWMKRKAIKLLLLKFNLLVNMLLNFVSKLFIHGFDYFVFSHLFYDLFADLVYLRMPCEYLLWLFPQLFRFFIFEQPIL